MSSNNPTHTLSLNMTKVIDIPRIMAAKAHTGPSILDLTPEMRNMIIVQLFEHKEKIRLNYSEHEVVPDIAAQYLPIPEKIDAYVSIGDGINLLLSCRQLYYEGASILYTNNTFVFGKKPEDHLEELGVMDLCAAWCGLGYKLRFLRKVDIDLATFCFHDCGKRHVQPDASVNSVLEESIACMEEESQIWACHAQYFGTDAIGNNSGRPNAPKNQLHRTADSFSRPAIYSPAYRLARAYKAPNGRSESMKGV
jgi:hypothetical protein